MLIEFCNEKKLKKGRQGTQEHISKRLRQIKSHTHRGKYIGDFLSRLKLVDLNKVYKEDDKKKGTFIYK